MDWERDEWKWLRFVTSGGLCSWLCVDFALFQKALFTFIEERLISMFRLHRILRMHQAGLIYKWYLEHLPSKDRCWTTNKIMKATTHIVNLDDMQGSFFVLGLGKNMKV
jgi:hypothetical protein